MGKSFSKCFVFVLPKMFKQLHQVKCTHKKWWKNNTVRLTGFKILFWDDACASGKKKSTLFPGSVSNVSTVILIMSRRRCCFPVCAGNMAGKKKKKPYCKFLNDISVCLSFDSIRLGRHVCDGFSSLTAVPSSPCAFIFILTFPLAFFSSVPALVLSLVFTVIVSTCSVFCLLIRLSVLTLLGDGPFPEVFSDLFHVDPKT